MNKKYSISESGERIAVSEPAMAYAARPVSVFSTYQMQILDCIANVHDEDEMRDIRNIIADYFSNKALDAMDRLCDEGKLSTEAIESWQSEHMRTPYKY